MEQTATPKFPAFIFARGGSKGIPGKNLCILGDRTLLAHSITASLSCPFINRVIVSTDDPQIAIEARKWKAEVPFVRPKSLSEDTSPEWFAWRHAIEWYQQNIGKLELFISVPTTAPFRSSTDISECIAQMTQKSSFDIVITGTPARRNPWFNMVVKLDTNEVKLVKTEKQYDRRQEAPKTFDLTTVCYVAQTGFILKQDGIFKGKVGMVEIPEDRALDIDTPQDLDIARFLYSRKLFQEENEHA